MKKIKILVLLVMTILTFDIGIGSSNGDAGSSQSSGPLKVLYSKENKIDKGKQKPPADNTQILTVGEFFLQQLQQFRSIRAVMEQQLSRNLQPTSPIYQKMIQMNQLRTAMFEEFVALTAGDERPLSVMMDPKSGLHEQIRGVQQKYEVSINQLEAELGPYFQEHMMQMQIQAMTLPLPSSAPSQNADHRESSDFEDSGMAPPTDEPAETVTVTTELVG